MGSLAGKSVLVTGGAGFLGAALCAALKANGCHVTATSRRAPVTGPPGVAWRSTNLEELDATSRLLAELQPDVVYHFAGDVSAAPGAERVLTAFHSLLTSTVNLLTAALRERRPRIVLAGSLTEPDDDSPLSQTPTSPYSAAKWAASGYARMFNQLYGLEAIVVRPFMTYGPGQKPEKLVPYVARCCLTGDAPRLASGRQRSDWVYIDDVVEGMVLAATATGLDATPIDLGSGELTSTRAVVEKIAELSGGGVAPEFGALPDRPFERERAAHLERARDLLGWRPRTSLNVGLARTVAALREQLSQANVPGNASGALLG